MRRGRGAAGSCLVCTVRKKRKAGMQRKVGGNPPPANHSIDHRIRASTKPAAFSKGQVIHHVPIEEPGSIGDATSIVALGVVGVLEEEPEAGLARGSGKRFLVAERAEVTQAVAHALGPGIVRAKLQTLPCALFQADLQCVVALNTA